MEISRKAEVEDDAYRYGVSGVSNMQLSSLSSAAGFFGTILLIWGGNQM